MITTKIVIAYVFSIIAMISIFIMSQQANKNKLLICKLISDMCWAIHYFLLGALGGVIPNFVGVFHDLAFAERGKKKFFPEFTCLFSLSPLILLSVFLHLISR